MENKDIIKVCILDEKCNTAHILLFCNENNDDNYEQFFSKEEWETYNNMTPRPHFHLIPTRIHLDDTVQEIKYKIWSALFSSNKKIIEEFSYEEMYLFHVIETSYQLLPWYKEVTNDERKPLYKHTLLSLLANYCNNKSELEKISILKTSELDNSPPTEELLYENIEEMNWFSETKKMEKIPLGVKFMFPTPPILRDKDSSFCVNPYNLNKHFVASGYLKNRKVKVSRDSELLFSSGMPYLQTITLCLAKNVFAYSADNDISQELVREIYYPKLPQKSFEAFELQDKPEFLNKMRQQCTNQKLLTYQDNINALYNLQHNPQSNITYVDDQHGISDFYFIKHPYEFKAMPVNTVFKQMHATAHIPIIHYSSTSRHDSMYRLYCEGTTESGLQIPSMTPLLKKKMSIKTLKTYSRNNQIVLYVQYDTKKTADSINDFLRVCFEENGNIHIEGHLINPVQRDKIEVWLQNVLQYAFDAMNNIIVPMGFKIQKIVSLKDSYLQTVYIHHKCTVNIGKKLDIESYMSCLSSIFFYKLEKAKKDKTVGVELIYTRVEDFEKLSTEEEFIANLLRQNEGKVVSRSALKSAILNKFPNQDPELILTQYQDREGQRIIPGRYTNQDKSNSKNGGFTVSIVRDNVFSYDYVFTVKFIHNVSYLTTVPVLIDSVIRLIMHPNGDMKKICKIVEPIQDKDFLQHTKYNDELPKTYETEIPKENENETENIVLADDLWSHASEDVSEEDDELSDYVQEKEEDDELEIAESNTDKAFTVKIPDADAIPEDDGKKNEEVDAAAVDDDDDVDVDVAATDDDDDEDDISLDDMYESDNESKNTNNQEQDDEEEEMMMGGVVTGGVVTGGVVTGGVKNKDKEWNSISDYYAARIKQRDPELHDIISGQYNRRVNVQHTDKPVILTESELESHKEFIDEQKKTDKNNFYQKHLKYRKKNGQDLYYICPKYWCTKPNMEGPITEEQVKSGYCGKIIQHRSKRKEDEFIIEHYKDKKKEGEIKPYPGLLIPGDNDKYDKDGNPICYPNCYKNWDGSQANVRNQCNPSVYESANKQKDKLVNKKAKKGKEEEKEKEEKEKEEKNDEENVQGNDEQEDPLPTINFKPIDVNLREKKREILSENRLLTSKRMGKLPSIVQKFLQCEFNGNRLTANSTDYALLRYGVQKVKNKKDTFLACLADILSYERMVESDQIIDDEEDISIEEFRNILAEAITFDKFVGLHNGSVASVFQPSSEIIQKQIVNKDKYIKSDFAKHFKTEESDNSFFKATVASYENFQAYLRDPESTVDYTYLWDVINTNNDKLFYRGYNLIIVELFDNNDQVGIVCPHAYATNMITNEEVILLLKVGEIYSPLYLIRSSTADKKGTSEIYHVRKTIPYLEDTNTSHPVHKVIRNIMKNMELYCQAKHPVTKTFQHGEDATTLHKILTLEKNKDKFKVIGGVWNNRNKVVGILVQEHNSSNKFMIPCYASTVNHQLASKYLNFHSIDSSEIRNAYKSTIEMLKRMKRLTNYKCEPINRIVENNKVVGILTESHHFVPVEPTEIGKDGKLGDELDDVEPLYEGDHIKTDKALLNGKPKPKNKKSHYIDLESRFFITFRNKMRQLINTFSKNRNIRKDIITVYNKSDLSFKEKLDDLQEKLKELGKEDFVFEDFTESELMGIHTVHLCSEKCNENGDTSYCINRDEKCKLKIPRTNLNLENTLNETEYYQRLAEEILTHRMIHLYVLYPNKYSDFGTDDFLVDNNEIIVHFNNLNVSYFDKLNMRFNSKYVVKNTYETMPSEKEPKTDINWEDEIRINKQ